MVLIVADLTNDIEMYEQTFYGMQVQYLDENDQPVDLGLEGWTGRGQIRSEPGGQLYMDMQVDIEGDTVTYYFQAGGPFRGRFDVFLDPPDGAPPEFLVGGAVRIKKAVTV